ncbi:MAG: alanine racemase [Oligoflexus sp.]
MRCRIELDAQALRENYRTFCQISNDAIAIPVIKSNAYGHGLREVYQILATEQPPWLAVNYPEEGRELRHYQYTGRILVVGPTDPKHFAWCHEEKLEIILGDFPSIAAWQALPQGPIGHIKIDTGMSRQGFIPEDLPQLLKLLRPEDQQQLYGICSHFANVEDVLEHENALKQLERFQQAKDKFAAAGFKLAPHIASSASTLLMEPSLFAMTRIGISLYGVWPSGKTRLSYLQNHQTIADLRPVLSWRTEVALTKTVKEGDFIGYGCTYRAVQDMKIAVLPVGYYEGYPRVASGRGSYVLIKGKRCPLVGRICMNMMMVDISHLQHVAAGDPVTLIGADGQESISAEDLAAWSDTIHYELFTRLNPRIPRILV